MSKAIHFLKEQKCEEEALVILSALGFSLKDWPFIEKVGPLKLLSSDLMQEILLKQAIKNPRLQNFLDTARASLDCFYETSGFLISPLSHPSSRLFASGPAPLVFFGRFNQNLLFNKRSIAIVGSRNASPVGIAHAQNLASILAKNGVPIISGGACGIDYAAHKGALLAHGETILVAGVTCDFCAEDKLFREFKNSAARLTVLYPFGPFLPQGKFMFVERNRFVASLSSALVIIQGKKSSGTLHTANFAKTLNVPIFAVPGAISDPLYFIPNYLLNEGMARALVDFDQFADAFVTNTNKTFKRQELKAKEHMANIKMATKLPYLLQVISDHENSLSFDELLKLTGKSFGDLQGELLDYELEGRVFKRGSQFVLTGN